MRSPSGWSRRSTSGSAKADQVTGRARLRRQLQAGHTERDTVPVGSPARVRRLYVGGVNRSASSPVVERDQMFRRVVPVAFVLVLVAGAAACGNKSNEPEVAFTVPPQSAKDKPCVEAKAASVAVPGSTTPGSSVPGGQSTTLPGAPSTTAAASPGAGKPVVKVPVGPPPKELQKIDLREGTGAEVKPGDAVKVQYVGIACSTGKEFDSSWDKGGQPADLTLTEGGLIPGWVKGIPGMKAGGQRMLVVPPADGYGANGQSPDILPDETLIFVVDVIETGPPPSTTLPTPGQPGAVPGQPGATPGQPVTTPAPGAAPTPGAATAESTTSQAPGSATGQPPAAPAPSTTSAPTTAAPK